MVILWDIDDLYLANNHQTKKKQDLEPVLLTNQLISNRPCSSSYTFSETVSLGLCFRDLFTPQIRWSLEHWGCGSSHQWDVHP